MKFSIPTNWQNDLILKVKKQSVDELYGKLASDFVGGGRPAYTIPYVSKRQVTIHTKEAHKNSLKFNYLLNAACLSNREYTISGQRKLHRLLDWLMDIGVDSVTIAIPYLLELIKRQYPKFKVCVSTQAGVNTIERAKYWEDLGADQITLSVVEVNRDFKLLREIKKNIKCELQLIANLPCLYRCPLWTYHRVSISHGSQSEHPSRGFMIDYCFIWCSYKRIAEPINFIRAGWIRPEDIHYYEDIGIDRIKLVDRGMTTEWISLIVDAYTARSYDGNLIDLFPSPSKNMMFQRPNILHKMRYFFHPFLINVFELYKLKDLSTDLNIYIDNRKLDGFLEHFLKNDCRLTSCQGCGYCEGIAKQVIKVDLDYQQRTSEKYREYLENLNSSKMFRYFKR